jgi:hypothetical protein
VSWGKVSAGLSPRSLRRMLSGSASAAAPPDESGRREVRRHFRIGAAILVAYALLVSHNLAWLNISQGETGRMPNVFPSQRIPYGWEYNGDSGLELYSAIDFPAGMARERSRIARPLKNALISACIEIAAWVHPLTPRQKLGASYLLHHAMILLLPLAAYWFALRLALRQRVPLPGVLFCWAWLVSENPGWWSISHTYVFQFVTTVFVLAVLQRCTDIRSAVGAREYAVLLYLYWLLAGFLTLVKQDYAPFLAVLSFALYRRWFWQSAIGACGVVTPYLLYRALLRAARIEWYNHEVASYGQGTWFIASVGEKGLLPTVAKGLRHFEASCTGLLTSYGLLTVLAAAGLLLAWRTLRDPVRGDATCSPDCRRLPASNDGPNTPGCHAVTRAGSWLPLAASLLVWNIVQITATRNTDGYLYAGLFIPVAFCVSLAGAEIDRLWRFRVPLRAVAVAYLAVHACIRLNELLRLPWQSPLNIFGAG